MTTPQPPTFDLWWEWPFELYFEGDGDEVYSLSGKIDGGHRADAIKWDSVTIWNEDADDYSNLSAAELRDFTSRYQQRVFTELDREVRATLAKRQAQGGAQ